ncbi:MAG: hypothetical protein GY904_25520, partial [Planctomycetaceae bacterium]|nr:hypothetical protein [Planctomycetaceae bacterium]
DGNGTKKYLVEYTSDPRPVNYLDATLTITSDDLGNQGVGGFLTDTDSIAIDVTTPPAFEASPSHHTMPATLDPSFGTNGQQVVSITDDLEIIYDMQELDDGKILAVGALNDNFGIMRFNADMTLDTTFGDGGGKRLDAGTGVHARTFAIDSLGRIIVVGGNRIARFTADGALDTTFSEDGWATDDHVAQCYGITIEADGNYLVAG